MAMQSDVKATKPLTATGAFKDQGNNNIGRTRIKAIYAICGATAGSVVLVDGLGGNTLFSFTTPAAAETGYVYIILPGEGILADNGLYGTVTTTASTVVFYA